MNTFMGFNPDEDLAPTPFDEKICRLALEMKELGLSWRPHVGCFVWDPDQHIKPTSPFPGRVYFILSLKRFLEIFGTMEEITQKLVWVPTWHQARLLCQGMGINNVSWADDQNFDHPSDPIDELLHLYEAIIARLQRAKKDPIP
jgi:hypothetical protein